MVINEDRFRKAESDVAGKTIKIKYQSINDVVLQEVKEGEAGFELAMQVRYHAYDSMGKVENDLREQLIRNNWWLKAMWTQKGLPKEQISITINGHIIDAYNWNNERLSEEQISQIRDVLSKFAIIAGGIALKRVRYILIDNLREINPKSREEINGRGTGHDQVIWLYLRAIRPISHRVEGATNLEGTLIHELSHSLTYIIEIDWAKKFGWRRLGSPNKIFLDGSYSMWQLEIPARAVTTYAGEFDPGEDICESMVAALKNPEILDRERLDFLRGSFLQPLDERDNEIHISVERFYKNNIVLPAVASPVRFKRHILELEEIPVEYQVDEESLASWFPSFQPRVIDNAI
ncbi:MAG: hypothetical protein Q7O04_04565 [Candidatus Omnitrophota bacterium]|nr:hypothetical protein [Candidatus Omnitrophota bacterium]